jgi:hypothetical protein
MTLIAPATSHPLDILGSGPWRSATFSTFALSLSFFESLILRRLRAAGCNEVTVFVDPLGYRNSLIESQLIGAGSSYRVIPVSAGTGAFHLKFCFLKAASEKDPDCLLVGSGNLTFGGYGNNAELLDVFLSSEQPGIFSAFAGVVDLLADMPNNPAAVSKAFRDLRQQVASGRPGQVTDDTVRLACSLEAPIAQSVASEARQLGACRRITLLSPYFESLKAVEDLWSALGKPELRIALPDDDRQISRFPFAKAKAAGLPVKAVAAKPPFERPFHAKLLEVQCERGVLLVSGSANATVPALWGQDNVELAVLCRLTPRATRPISWEAAEVPADIEIPPLASSQIQTACLFAEITENGHLAGHIVNARSVAGTWHWHILAPGRVLASSRVDVAAGGAFDIDKVDVPFGTGAIQLRLTRTGFAQIEGWINQPVLLRARRTFGQVIEPVLRLMTGEPDPRDLESVITWLCRQDIAIPRRGKRRKDGAAEEEEVSELIPLAVLEPSAPPPTFEEPIPGSGFSLAATLLSGLRQRFRSYSKTDDDEDPTDQDPKSEKKRLAAQKHREDRQAALEATLDRFQGTLWEIVDDDKRAEKDRRTASVWLLDMSLFVFLQRSEPGDAQTRQYCRTWVTRIVGRFRKGDEAAPDELDRAVITICAALASIHDPQSNHLRPLAATLQHYFAGLLDRTQVGACLREADALGTEALEVSSIDVLKGSLDRLCLIETDWQIATGVLAALKCGSSPELSSSWLDKEKRDQAEIINVLLSPRVRQQPLRHISEMSDAKVDSCARCNLNLALAPRQMINLKHVAHCSNCGQLLFKTVP